MSLPEIEAKYLGRACGAAQFTTSKKGNVQIVLPFIVVDGEYIGHTITWFGTMHDTPDSKGKTGKDRVVEALRHMGFVGDDLTSLMDISDEQAQRLLPNNVELVVRPEEYEGRINVKVQFINRAGGARIDVKNAMSKDDMRAFSARMRSVLKNVPVAQAALPTTMPAGPIPPVNPPSDSAWPSRPHDDDVPF